MSYYLGYLGPRGTFTEETALLYSRESYAPVLKEYNSIDHIIEDVALGNIEQGIVPLENSYEGSVGITLDMLVLNDDVYIYKELVYPISHCLMVPPGVAVNEIREVHSHMQAFSQCRNFLKGKLPAATLVPAESTAAAAKNIASSGGRKAAIAPARAAEICGLHLLVSDIQDGHNKGKNGNVTRFVIIAQQDHPATNHDKTSVILSIKDGPGSLYNILGVFAERAVNLTRIESRPARKNLGDYLFFIDFEGHRKDANIIKVLEELQGRVKFMKMLGSYPCVNL